MSTSSIKTWLAQNSPDSPMSTDRFRPIHFNADSVLRRILAAWILFAVCFPSYVAGDPSRPWFYLGIDGGNLRTFPATGFSVSADASMFNRASGTDSVSVDVLPQAAPFPLNEGSAFLWFKPDRPLDKANRWLLFGSWGRFDIHLQARQLIAYATDDHRNHLNLSLAASAGDWIDRWHSLVMTWQPGTVEVFLDGRFLGRRNDVSPLTRSPRTLRLGYLPASAKEPARGHLEGRFGEFAILRRALGPSEVAQLHRSGPGNAYRRLLADAGIGVTVETQRRAWVRGETAVLDLKPTASGARMRLWAEPDGADQGPPVLLWQGPAGPREIRFDTRELRPGRYLFSAELLSEETPYRSLRSESLPVHILAIRSPDFPVGIDGLAHYSDEVLAEASSWGLSFVSAGSLPRDDLFSTLDRLLYFGFGLIANLNIHHQKSMDLPDAGYFGADRRGSPRLIDEVLQTLVLHDDTNFSRYSSSLGSPFSPVARTAMRSGLIGYLEAVRDHPGLLALSFDDEYAFRIGTDKTTGKRYYGDYSPAARQHFRAITGLEPTFPPVAPPGTVFPDSLPYFRWRDVIGMPGDPTTAGLASSWAELARILHEMRPDVIATTWSGGEYGEVDVVMDYAYPVIWEPRPHFKLGHGRLDFLIDRRRARQRGDEPKPIWGLLGWWSHDLRDQPDWCVEDLRLNTVLALAKGVKAINWHTTWPPPKAHANRGNGILSRPDLRDEMIHWAGWLEEQGPMYARLDARRSGRVAALWSEDDRAGKLHRQAQPLQLHWFYPALRIAGFPVDIVTDTAIDQGKLGEYDALVLTDFDYASASLWRRIEAFADTPDKTVVIDAATALRPAGAVALPFAYGQRGDPHTDYRQEPMPPLEYMAWMAGRLRELLGDRLQGSPVRVQGSDYVAPFLLHAPDGRLLTLVNYHLQETQEVQVCSATDLGAYVYDAETGALLGAPCGHDNGVVWTVQIPAASSARYLLLARPVERIETELKIEGEDFVIRTKVTDDEGNPVRFPLPVKITLIDPAGHPIAAYTRHTALDPALGATELRIPVARRMDADGNWSVRIEELITGLRSHPSS